MKLVTIFRHLSGKYAVAFLCKEELLASPQIASTIGINLGNTNFTTLSEGQKIDTNPLTSKMAKKRKHEQRKLSEWALFAKKNDVHPI